MINGTNVPTLRSSCIICTCNVSYTGTVIISKTSKHFGLRTNHTHTHMNIIPVFSGCTLSMSENLAWKLATSLTLTAMQVANMRMKKDLKGNVGTSTIRYPAIDILSPDPCQWLNSHPWKLTCPLRMDHVTRKGIFQPLGFRGHVLFGWVIPINWVANNKGPLFRRNEDLAC